MGAFKGIEVADAGAGKFASGEHIAKRVAEVSVDAASKGFFGTVAGKATVALASLAVAGGKGYDSNVWDVEQNKL